MNTIGNILNSGIKTVGLVMGAGIVIFGLIGAGKDTIAFLKKSENGSLWKIVSKVLILIVGLGIIFTVVDGWKGFGQKGANVVKKAIDTTEKVESEFKP